MAIERIIGSVEYNVGVIPSTVLVNTTDTLATVMGVGYLNGTDETWGITWSSSLLCLVTCSDTTPVWLAVSIDGSSNVSLIAPSTV